MRRKRLRDASTLFAVCILEASRNQRVKKKMRQKRLRDAFTLPAPLRQPSRNLLIKKVKQSLNNNSTCSSRHNLGPFKIQPHIPSLTIIYGTTLVVLELLIGMVTAGMRNMRDRIPSVKVMMQMATSSCGKDIHVINNDYVTFAVELSGNNSFYKYTQPDAPKFILQEMVMDKAGMMIREEKLMRIIPGVLPLGLGLTVLWKPTGPPGHNDLVQNISVLEVHARRPRTGDREPDDD
ncbi:hypothetical protein PoB_004699100 [Plakobranchus ocellatus]|uniref:Uncharacterized protein n=1 Tax=Plakobranchus ocellatus TaxID=259542 RepID=A0AAV4BAY9_9GAST|nr:hypothetical protein PoB_004699100 [Plakobranchus ocellatus]